MYGQIHVVFKEMVLEKYGTVMWNRVVEQAHLDDEKDFLQFSNYPDHSFIGLITAICECVGESKPQVLEDFGEFFIKYCLMFRYDKMLLTLGSDIVSFIQNLDSLHSLLSLTYKGIMPPSFRCEKTESGELLLHYYSCRAGLYPLVIGLIRAAGREIFRRTVELNKLTTLVEDLGEGRFQEHCVFRVLILNFAEVSVGTIRSMSAVSPTAGHDEPSCDAIATLRKPELDPGISLTGFQFCRTFPYHVFFDEHLRILQCGEVLKRMLPAGTGPGSLMTDAFEISYPRMAWSIENVQQFTNAIFMLAVRQRNGINRKQLRIKGQMIWLENERRMMFMGSPHLKSLQEMKEMDVYMADIPLFDVTREIVLLYEQRNAEIGITQKLDLTTAELMRTSLALEVEKQKTEQLLHQMLPPKVARQLKNGQFVEAETFQQATIMFSDIVTFTNIAAICSPEKIVNMLNDMYERFDHATNERGVYKVETIGDAYMVVGGVPEPTTYHAQRVALFAMDIIGAATYVPSPATGQPLQIRVGIHTGTVMAGVVGIKMPRYCLFGDTVNTASRMESHGVPGRIHLSPEVFRSLAGHDFQFKKRGTIQVKGKGLMTTYFLVGDSMLEPDDEFASLPRLSYHDESGAVQVIHCSHNGSSHSLSEQTAEANALLATDIARRMPSRTLKPDYSFLVSGNPDVNLPSSVKTQSKLCTLM